MTPSSDLDRADRILRGLEPQTPETLAWARHVAYRSLDHKLVELADLHCGAGVPLWPIAAFVIAVSAIAAALALAATL
jgi:hypothetical protein